MAALTFTPEALNLLERFQVGQFPVHVISVAEELGISVFSDTAYPASGNGHIQLEEDSTASIIVNDGQSYGRKRFTIAHEIAHFVMDMDYLREHRSIDRDGNAADSSYRAREKRANEFAAELLMPEAEFVRQWVALGNLDRVADYFGVSKAAATWRSVNTGVAKAE